MAFDDSQISMVECENLWSSLGLPPNWAKQTPPAPQTFGPAYSTLISPMILADHPLRQLLYASSIE